MRKSIVAALALAAASVGPSACSPGNVTAPATDAALGIDKAAMDPSISPGNDFYGYANGHWMKTTEIPADTAAVVLAGPRQPLLPQEVQFAVDRFLILPDLDSEVS